MSKPIEFDPAFVTGVEEIDTQHRNLIHLTNEAGRVLVGNPPPRVMRAMVQELLSYAIYHFRTEEALMREYGYIEAGADNADEHIRRHRDFSVRVVEMQKALQNHEPVNCAELNAFLTDWVAKHIMGTDQQLAAFILEKRTAQRD